MKNINVLSEPINLDDFDKIREQINFINRPERKIEWSIVYNLSQKIFRENGFDLYTFIYFIIAEQKTKNNYDLLIENIKKLSELLQYHWETIYPQALDSRVAILNWFNRQISDDVYKLTYQNTDIDKFILLEKSLSIILQLLDSHKQACNLKNLLFFIQEKIKEDQYNVVDENLLIITSVENSMPKNKGDYITDTGIAINNDVLDNVRKQDNIILNSSRLPFYRSPIFSVLCFFVGAIVSYLLNNIIKQRTDNLQETISTPLYGIYQAKKIMLYSAKDDISKWEEKLSYYTALGEQSLVQDKLRERLEDLQNELLLAEKNKHGLTISYLKTSLYNMEKELDRVDGLEQKLSDLSKNKDDLLLRQKIEQQFLSLLAYYNKLIEENK